MERVGMIKWETHTGLFLYISSSVELERYAFNKWTSLYTNVHMCVETHCSDSDCPTFKSHVFTGFIHHRIELFSEMRLNVLLTPYSDQECCRGFICDLNKSWLWRTSNGWVKIVINMEQHRWSLPTVNVQTKACDTTLEYDEVIRSLATSSKWILF